MSGAEFMMQFLVSDRMEEFLVDLQDIQELIATLDKSNLSEIEIEKEGYRIRLTKATTEVLAQQPIPLAHASHVPHSIQVLQHPVAQGAHAPEQTVDNTEPEEDDGLVTIDSPMVGTFYSSPSPSDPPFFKVGDRVEEGQTVCIVEAMKLMNEVSAKFHCVIEKILVENAEPVEFGQALFAVRHL